MEVVEPPHEPPVTGEPPKIAIGRLWASLLLPPVIVCLVYLAILGNNYSPASGELLITIVLVIMGLSTWWFVVICRVRFRGRSLVLMSIGYVILQLILLATILIGTCLAAFNLKYS